MVESVNVKFTGTLYLYQDESQFTSAAGTEKSIKKLNKTVENGVWEIEAGNVKNENKMEVVLVIPSIKRVELSGGGRIIADESFTQNNIEIINNGSGDIIFNQLKLDSLYTEVNQNGSIKLSGAGSRASKIRNTGSGNFELYQFPIKNVEVETADKGNVFITVIDYIKAHINGSGSIYYQGNPTINKDGSGSGDVIQKNSNE